MKKVIFGLLLLVGGVLFLINYLGVITLNQTDKVSDNAQKQLVATGNKPVQNQPMANTKTTETKQTIEDALEPLKKQLLQTEQQIEKSIDKSTSKPPIATIKVYDPKSAKEITIESQAQLEAQQQPITQQQQDEEKIKMEKFKSFYHKSKKCLSPSDQETRVACGNEHMRAKAKFEELYKQGKL